LEEAIAQIPAAVQRFYDFWDANQAYTPYGSFMGEMSFEDVELFHYMHFRYHLWQFDLIEQYP
ncbi:MAG: oxepin-CoA hydrolase/3-oxo-5,6-dehydrosuberyl-CoA semialdehyde dehydrogenase, partial [Saprospiraceae bacterium]